MNKAKFWFKAIVVLSFLITVILLNGCKSKKDKKENIEIVKQHYADSINNNIINSKYKLFNLEGKGFKFITSSLTISRINCTHIERGYLIEGIIGNTSSVAIGDITISCIITDSVTKKSYYSSTTYQEYLKSGQINSFSVYIRTSDIPEGRELTYETIIPEPGEERKIYNKEGFLKFNEIGVMIPNFSIKYSGFVDVDEEEVNSDFLIDTFYSPPLNFWDSLKLAKGKSRNVLKKYPSKKKKLSIAEMRALHRQNILKTEIYSNHLPEIAAQSKNPFEGSKEYELDDEKLNFKRFENSPCYSKIGFNPMLATKDSVGLEEQYQNCENEYYSSRNRRIIVTSLFTVLAILILFYFFRLTKKRKNV